MLWASAVHPLWGRGTQWGQPVSAECRKAEGHTDLSWGSQQEREDKAQGLTGLWWAEREGLDGPRPGDQELGEWPLSFPGDREE